MVVVFKPSSTSGRVILNRGLEDSDAFWVRGFCPKSRRINSTDGLSGKEIACQVVLSLLSCLDKWRGSGNTNSRELEAYTVFSESV